MLVKLMLAWRLRVVVVLACALCVASVSASGAFGSASFGIEHYALTVTEEGGLADTQAGSHPYELTAEAVLQPNAHNTSADEVKDLDFELPPGLVIDLAGVPVNSAVGMMQMSIAGKLATATVYKLAPAPGEFARLGFTLEGIPLVADISVRTGSNDGMTLSIQDLPEWKMETVKLEMGGGGSYPGLVTLPGSCTGTLDSVLSADSWATPGVFAEASSATPALTGCNRLPFAPSLAVIPNVSQVDEPSGYELNLSVPQHEEPTGLASAQLKDVAVTLPQGAGISLSAADGLQACSQAQVGLASLAPVTCPAASKVGEVKVQTPLLASPLEGSVFLASPNANPFGSPLALYLVAEGGGVLIKLAGELEPNLVTGQLAIVLRELPRLPISELDLRFYGGPRALLVNPDVCGLATSTSEETPWSGNTNVIPSSSFEVDGCTEPRFNPAFRVASTTNEAGAYNSLTFVVSRVSGEEYLSTVEIQAPPAVADMFTGVSPCGEPLASEGLCPVTSEIGIVTLAAGSGPDPYYLKGNVYLTGPYRGASQGLSIVVPFNAGPFQLGTVVIRGTEQIDPDTGRMTIVSDPMPSVLDGISLRLKELALQLDRGEFELNSDGCEPLTITGTLASTQGNPVVISTDPLGAPSSQCNPAQADNPVSALIESSVSSSTATVLLDGIRIVTTRGGEAAVKLICRGTGTCRGKLTLTVKTSGKGKKKTRSKTTAIGTAAFSIPGGKTTTIKLALNATGRALLSADHGRLSATLTIVKSSPVPSQTHTEKVQLVPQKAHGKAKKGSLT